MTAGEELPFAGFVELFARIVPCRLQQPVARDGAVALSGNERLGDEAEQRIDDCGRGEIGACRNRLGGSRLNVPLKIESRRRTTRSGSESSP